MSSPVDSLFATALGLEKKGQKGGMVYAYGGKRAPYVNPLGAGNQAAEFRFEINLCGFESHLIHE